jgi:O-acetylserine/cysteine efflux transporter
MSAIIETDNSEQGPPVKQAMTLTDILMALGVVTIWGVNFVVIKVGLRDVPPILLTSLRFVLAALPLVFFVKRPRTPLGLVLAYGVFQFALQFALLFTGIELGLPAGLASLVMQLQAFFTIGLAVLALGERPKGLQLTGALIAFGGMALVAMHLEGKATLTGFVLAVLGAMCWAVANILTKRMGAPNALSLVVWGSLVAAPLLLLASWIAEGGAAWRQAAHDFSGETLALLLFQAYPSTILAFGMWSMLMRKYPTATVAPFSLLVPVAGMISAAIVLGEALQWWKVVAGLLVLGGLALNQFGGRLWTMATARR